LRNIPLSIVITGQLKELIWECKEAAIIKWIKDFLEGSEEKLVIYTIHHRVTDTLRQAFPRISVRIDGRDSLKGRDEAEKKLNDDSKIRILVASFAVDAKAIVGRDFKSSNIAIVEMGWTPGQHDQAIDRCHGIGRGTGKALVIWWLLAKGTIEEDIAELIDKKRKIMAKTLDGKGVQKEDLLAELIKRRK